MGPLESDDLMFWDVRPGLCRDVVSLEDIEVPLPASGEVQIEVKSIGLNRAEVMFRTHAYPQEAHFPSRLGYEAAGIVKATGSDVPGFM
jgi:NADPH:quinone reductase-like Zn-dependent oxidoreductase